MFRRFLDAADYWFGYSDDSSAGSYDPARECCVVIANDPANAAEVMGAGDGEVPPALGNGSRLAAGPSAPPSSPPREADINAQLAQVRKLEAKLAEEFCTVRLLRASIVGEASARGERASELGRQARDRINADFNVNNPDTPPRASQKLIAAATLLRAMPAPSTPEARNLHREAQALIEQAAVRQAESSASRIRQLVSARDDGVRKAPSPRCMRVARPSAPPILGARRPRIGSSTCAGKPETATTATSSTPEGRAKRRRLLRHYFEAHPVTVVSSFPLGEIIRNPDAVGKIAKWPVELMGETLAYAPRKAIKSQILADFVAEWTDTQLPPP
jgi:hypothetical protein